MAKISVIVLADSETHGDMGRVANALALVKEAKEAGDDVELVFDGAGVTWVPALTDPEHDMHPMYASVEDRVAGACEFCANAFGVKDEVKTSDVPFLSEFEGHPSLRSRIVDGYQVITF